MNANLHARIEVRAYFAAQNDGYRNSAEAYWLAAERVEIIERRKAYEAAELAFKRSAAAKRGAATRAANKAAKALTTPTKPTKPRKAAPELRTH